MVERASAPVLWGIAGVTGATILLQVLLTRIFSVTLYYHFAFLVVSLALFGLGLSGVYLFFRRAHHPREGLENAMAWVSVAAAAATILALLVVVRMNPQAQFEPAVLKTLAIVYVVCTPPFFLSGLIVSLAIYHYRDDVARVYLYDLVGAGAACLLAVLLLDWLGALTAVLVAAALLASAGVAFASAGDKGNRSGRTARIVCLVGAASCLVLASINTRTGLIAIEASKGLKETDIEFSGWNSFSRVTVEAADRDSRWLKMDAGAASRIWSGALVERAIAAGSEPERAGAHPYFVRRHQSLAYLLHGPTAPVLVIGPGGGADVAGALVQGKQNVRGVELNPIIVDDIMKGAYARFSGDLYRRPGVDVVVGEGRAFVRHGHERYSVIVATLVDTWAATSVGAFALSENNLYTLEAFTDFFEHLTDDGVLSITRWYATPRGEYERLLVMTRTALERLGRADASSVHRHFYIAGDTATATMLAKKSAFTKAELDLLRSHGARSKQRVLFDPESPKGRFDAVLRAEDLQNLIEKSRFDIAPATDDRPFFFYSLKPSRLFGEIFDLKRLELENMGVLMLLASIAVVTLLVLVFLVGPLLLLRRRDLSENAGQKLVAIAYFIGLGLGYILVELAFVQRLVVFLGHPVYALSVVLFTLLIASGIGSFRSGGIALDRLHATAKRLGLGLVLLLIATTVCLPLLLDQMVGASLAVRMAASVVILFPLGYLMGMMLPSGVRLLARRYESIIPWGWGMNGAASVWGSVLGAAIGMNLGLSATLGAGAVAYALASAALFRLRA